MYLAGLAVFGDAPGEAGDGFHGGTGAEISVSGIWSTLGWGSWE